MIGFFDVSTSAKLLSMCCKEFRQKIVYPGHIKPIPRSSPNSKLRFRKKDVISLVEKLEKGEVKI